MPLLFKDYTNLVLKEFEKSRNANQLSRLLMHPTPANIRQECLNVFNERIVNKGEVEEDILRAFFGVPPSGKRFDYVIERFDADRFRPIRKLIIGQIRNPALVSVELLAWLIDFKPRPLAYAQRVLAVTNGQNGIIEPEVDVKEEYELDNLASGEPRLKNEIERENKRYMVNKGDPGIFYRIPKINLVSIIGITLAILCAAVYLITLQATSAEKISENPGSGCMQWMNDHFEKVPCDEQQFGLPILPLNEKKIKNFRMITKVDTMTEWSIGKVFYIKDKGTIKFYTEAGKYPEDLSRSLKVLSPYMFDKYLRKK